MVGAGSLGVLTSFPDDERQEKYKQYTKVKHRGPGIRRTDGQNSQDSQYQQSFVSQLCVKEIQPRGNGHAQAKKLHHHGHDGTTRSEMQGSIIDAPAGAKDQIDRRQHRYIPCSSFNSHRLLLRWPNND